MRLQYNVAWRKVSFVHLLDDRNVDHFYFQLYGFMKIEMAIIGNNGSLLFSQYSPYGTLLDVCNGVFTSLQNNVNETIVFILAYQMLDLIDHLHRADILHLDLKPDNFLVMKK